MSHPGGLTPRCPRNRHAFRRHCLGDHSHECPRNGRRASWTRAAAPGAAAADVPATSTPRGHTDRRRPSRGVPRSFAWSACRHSYRWRAGFPTDSARRGRSPGVRGARALRRAADETRPERRVPARGAGAHWRRRRRGAGPREGRASRRQRVKVAGRQTRQRFSPGQPLRRRERRPRQRRRAPRRERLLARAPASAALHAPDPTEAPRPETRRQPRKASAASRTRRGRASPRIPRSNRPRPTGFRPTTLAAHFSAPWCNLP